MLLTDWPVELLSDFWANHSILAGILSTVLLVGVVFLAFEDSEQRRQDVLDAGLTATGLGGIVDHVVDAEVALALLSRNAPPHEPDWVGWDSDEKPLRWLRYGRERLYRVGPDVGAEDPRRSPPTLPLAVEDGGWRVVLVDQCVRRLLGAIRDWSPLIAGSRNGVQVLLALSELRKDLVELSKLLGDKRVGAEVEPLLRSLRQRLRILAHFFEKQSGAEPLRPEVLLTLNPLPNASSPVDWAADPRGHQLFSVDWQKELSHSQRALEQGHVG